MPPSVLLPYYCYNILHKEEVGVYLPAVMMMNEMFVCRLQRRRGGEIDASMCSSSCPPPRPGLPKKRYVCTTDGSYTRAAPGYINIFFFARVPPKASREVRNRLARLNGQESRTAVEEVDEIGPMSRMSRPIPACGNRSSNTFTKRWGQARLPNEQENLLRLDYGFNQVFS